METIKNWLENSSSHGIRRICRSKSVFSRYFWLLIFLVFTALMIIFIHQTVQKFIEHPTTIRLTVRQYQDEINYPAITFCKEKRIFVESLMNFLFSSNENRQSESGAKRKFCRWKQFSERKRISSKIHRIHEIDSRTKFERRK